MAVAAGTPAPAAVVVDATTLAVVAIAGVVFAVVGLATAEVNGTLETEVAPEKAGVAEALALSALRSIVVLPGLSTLLWSVLATCVEEVEGGLTNR